VRYYSFPKLREFAFLLPPLFFFRRRSERALLNLISVEGVYSPVVEVGCGVGYLSRKVARLLPDHSIIAIDSEEKMIELARKIPHPRNLRFFNMDFFDLEGKYPAIISMHVFMHFNIGKAFEKLIEITEKGSKIFLTMTKSAIFSKLHTAFYKKITGENLYLAMEEEIRKESEGRDFLCKIIPVDPYEASYIIFLSRRS